MFAGLNHLEYNFGCMDQAYRKTGRLYEPNCGCISRRHIGATGSSGLLFGMVGGGQTLSLEVVSNQAFYGDELMGRDGHSELPGPNMPPVYVE